jgi:hypothetical protein
MKQEPAEATMRNCHGSAVGILAINGEEKVNVEIKAAAGVVGNRRSMVTDAPAVLKHRSMLRHSVPNHDLGSGLRCS